MSKIHLSYKSNYIPICRVGYYRNIRLTSDRSKVTCKLCISIIDYMDFLYYNLHLKELNEEISKIILYTRNELVRHGMLEEMPFDLRQELVNDGVYRRNVLGWDK